MKLMNICFVLVVLCGVTEKSRGTKLNCEFKEVKYFNSGTIYSCHVSSLENSNNNMVLTGHSGIHKPNKIQTDVEWIRIDNTNTKYIPKDLGLLFNLTKLRMTNTELVEIKSQDFIGMENLGRLNLAQNNLTSVPVDAFSTLTKLIVIHLSENQLEELPNGVFTNNLRLQQIWLSDNNIKFLGSTLFDGLTKLKTIDLRENICINKLYKGSTALTDFTNSIEFNCTTPNVLSTITTTQIPTDASSTTAQNSVENLDDFSVSQMNKFQKELLNAFNDNDDEEKEIIKQMLKVLEDNIKEELLKSRRNN